MKRKVALLLSLLLIFCCFADGFKASATDKREDLKYEPAPEESVNPGEPDAGLNPVIPETGTMENGDKTDTDNGESADAGQQTKTGLSKKALKRINAYIKNIDKYQKWYKAYTKSPEVVKDFLIWVGEKYGEAAPIQYINRLEKYNKRSYFAKYTGKTLPELFAEYSEENVRTVTLLAAGDNLYHSIIVEKGLQSNGKYNYDHIYKNLKDKIQSFDIAVVNQETVFAGSSVPYAGYPAFNTPSAAGDALIKAGFDVFLYANNHVLDQGKSGLLNTLKYWKNNHPEAVLVGVHETKEEADDVVIVEKNGIRIALLNYTYGTNRSRTSDTDYMVETLNKTRVKADLKYAKENADFTIVFPHWGTEYVTSADSSQKEWAQYLADNGADLIIGGHPHILQPVEEITAKDGRKVVCYYSLGNFVANMNKPEQQLGGMAEIKIVSDASGVHLEEAKYTVTISHLDYNQKGYATIYEFKNYSLELSKQHWQYASRGLRRDELEKFAKKVLGKWY